MLDEEIKKNIKKCARCALCIQNCPIYKIKKDENNTARGLICKLSGLEKGDLKEYQIKKDFKICLNCSKCKSNCPSGVDTTNIFSYKNAYFNPSLMSQRILLQIKLLPVKTLYLFNFFKAFNKEKDINSDIYYFKGCFSKSQHKKTYLDLTYKNPNFSCCGLPYLSSGDIKNYNKVKEKNIELIKKANMVVFDCATCKNTVEEYFELNEEEKKKLVFISDFLKKYKLKPNSKYKNKTITFHKPCHMSKHDFEQTEAFLKNIEGLNYKRLENVDSCCGFGGSYFMFHPIISFKIALEKMKNIKKTNADLILTSCPSCTLGLRFIQLITFNFKKTLELRDFTDKNLIQ